MTDKSTPSPFDFGDLCDAFARAFTLAAALQNRHFELHLAHCSNDDQSLILGVVSRADDEILSEFRWAATWYGTLLGTFAASWNMTPLEVHARITDGWTFDCEPDEDAPPYGEGLDGF